MHYLVDVIFCKTPRSMFSNYECEFHHKGYLIRRFKLEYTFVELLQFMAQLHFYKLSLVRITQVTEKGRKIIVDEFKGEY